MNKAIFTCLGMVLESNVCPETPYYEWLKIIQFAHDRGYLITNNKMDQFACAYRIPYWDEKFTSEMPEQESGNILYVAFAVSESKNNFSLLKMLKSYPDIEEVYWYHRNSDTDLRHYKIRRLVYG